MSARTVELRTAALDKAQVSGRSFAGHAAVFGQRTDIGNPLGWGFVEQVAKGAFVDSIRGGDVVMLADHEPSKPLARQTAGTLTLAEDRIGLATDATIASTSYGNDLIENLRVGNVAGMSFGFTVPAGGDTWTVEERQTPTGPVQVEVRTLNTVDLIEVSTTAFPAYPTTDAAVRSARAGHPMTARRSPDLAGSSLDFDLRYLKSRYGLPGLSSDPWVRNRQLRMMKMMRGDRMASRSSRHGR